MSTLAPPHAHEAPTRRTLLAAARILGSTALAFALAGLAAEGAHGLLATGVPLAPRVMVPL